MKSFMKLFTPLFAVALLVLSCKAEDFSSFVKVEDGRFVCEDYPSHFVGTNFWYGAILASEGEGGDRARLEKELDFLKENGIINLRVLVGGDGPDGIPTRVCPTLQKAPGVYNDTIFRGLDYLLAEMAERNMKAVLFVNNSWEWSGGYGMYLEWAGEGKSLIPAEVGYPAFMESVSKFVTSDKAKELYYNHLKHVVGRTNTVTGKAYKDDPAIFSWQIGNEPRCFRADAEGQQAFADFMWESAAIIKSIDPNHMVSSGSEGAWGCEMSMDLYEKIHSCPDIDYMNIHIWPYNWSWVRENTLDTNLPRAIANTDSYIDAHLEVAAKYGKPVVLEEFGFPRDGFQFAKGTPTVSRDKYYAHILSKIAASAREGGLFAGLNFWGWGGFAEQSETNLYWQVGDDYCGDPAQEQQGLNSVYACDESTVNVLKNGAQAIEKALEVTPARMLISRLKGLVKEGKIIYGHQDDLLYGHSWKLAEDATEFTQSDVFATCGKYPAVYGTDLGGIEIGWDASLDKNRFDHIRASAVAHHERGGVVTFSWHLRNPLTGGDTWDVTSTEVVKSVLPGGEKHEMFMGWLKNAADFMVSIKTADGELVPIIWRPWHEHTGSWFWWGQNICTTEQFKALWKMTYDYMMTERGMTNLVWAYSPGAGGLTPELFAERYPGDDMVDMVGFDCYQYATDEMYLSDMKTALDVTAAFAKEHNKIVAVTETGYEGIPSSDWWTKVLYESLKDYPVSYVLTWRNACDMEHHFYAPFPGHISADDFKAFTALENIMMVE